MTNDEFCDAAFQVLQRIENGDVGVELIEGDILEGRVTYQTSDGWNIVVLSDGDVWDYIRAMIPPTKEQIELWPKREEDDCAGFQKIRRYHPPADQLTAKWGFLG